MEQISSPQQVGLVTADRAQDQSYFKQGLIYLVVAVVLFGLLLCLPCLVL